jgi:hypothetical protein
MVLPGRADWDWAVVRNEVEVIGDSQVLALSRGHGRDPGIGELRQAVHRFITDGVVAEVLRGLVIVHDGQNRKDL